MLSFVNTAILLGLLGIGLPILIHLFARQKLRRIEFSSTAFLKAIQNRTMRRMKLRQMLLLVMRCLAVFLLVVAFARPTLRTGGSLIQGQAKSSVVFIMDRTLSMGRDGLFERARARAFSVLDFLNVEDEVALVTLPSQKESRVFSHSIADLRRRLNEWDVSAEGGEILRPVGDAAFLLAGSQNINREMVLVSDMQTTGFAGSEDSLQIPEFNGNLYVLPVDGDQENMAIIDGGLEEQILQPGSPVRVFAEVKNWGSRRIDGLLVRVFLRGEPVAQSVVSIDAQDKQRVRFRVLPDESGWVWGSIQLEDDALSLDNAYYFTRWIPERIHVLLVGNEPEDLRPLDLALTSPGDHRGIFELKETFHRQDWIAELDDADVVFFSNLPSFEPREANRLRRFIEEGGGVVFLMGDDVDLRNMNETFFVPVVKVTLGNILGDNQGGYLTFGTVTFDHPLFQGMFEQGKENVRSPRFSRVIETMENSSRPIITLGDGRPFLLEQTVGQGKVLIVTSGVGETWSDLAYSTFFAPLVTRSAAYLSTPALVKKNGYTVGESISLAVSLRDVDEPYRIEKPSGEEVLLLPSIGADRILLTFDETDQPGIYCFYQGETLIGMEAVNVDSRESNLTPISQDELEARLPGMHVFTIDETQDVESVVSRARWGKEFWKEMLLLGVFVLVAEMLIGREARKS